MDQHLYFKQCKLAALQAFDEGGTVQVRLDPGRETSLKLLFGLELASGFMQLDQEANSFARVACSAISTRCPEMVSDDEAQIIGEALKRFLQIPPSGDASLTQSAVDVIISTMDISVTDISMDRGLYEKGMNKWLFAPWFLILGVSWSWM